VYFNRSGTMMPFGPVLWYCENFGFGSAQNLAGAYSPKILILILFLGPPLKGGVL